MLTVSAERNCTGLGHRTLAVSPYGAHVPASLTAHTWASVPGAVSQCSEQSPVKREPPHATCNIPQSVLISVAKLV